MVDDSDEEAARIEALIDELSASTEVDASCTVTADEERRRDPHAVHGRRAPRSASGWRALAWRDHRHRLD
jgi:hypothetical protein